MSTYASSSPSGYGKSVLNQQAMSSFSSQIMSSAGVEAVRGQVERRARQIDRDCTVEAALSGPGVVRVSIITKERGKMVAALNEQNVPAAEGEVTRSLGGLKGMRKTRCVVVEVDKYKSNLTVLRVLANQYNFWPIVLSALVLLVIVALSMHHASSAISDFQ